jgi:hypothetical protein
MELWTGGHRYIIEKLRESYVGIFLEMKLRGFVTNFHLHVSESDLCIPTTGPPIFAAGK